MEQIEILRQAFDGRGLSCTPEQLSQFSTYLDFLMKWSRRMGLISKNDESRLVTRHLLPSAGLPLSVEIPNSCRVMDLGSGGGLPGIPLKLMRPDLDVLLVESRRKKAQFLRVVLRELSLPAIEVIEKRVEDLPGKIGVVDVVVSRAVADLVTLMGWCRGILKSSGGMLIAMKGASTEEEVDALKASPHARSVGCVETIPFDPFPGAHSLENCSLVRIVLGSA